MYLRILIILFFIISFEEGFSQNLLPDENFLISENHLLYNPAYTTTGQSHYGIASRYSSYLNDKKVLAKYYLEASLSIHDSSRFQAGLVFFHDEEGPFIKYNNIKIGGNYKIIRTENLTISAGLLVGIGNLSFLSNGVTGGGSSFATDVDAGIFGIYKRTSFGFAVSHIPSLKLKPLDYPVYFDRTYNLSLGQLINLGYLYSVNVNSLYRYGDYRGGRLNLYFEPMYKQKIGIILGLMNSNVLSLGLGLHNIDIYKFNLGMSLNYSSNIYQKAAFHDNRYELGFQIKSK